MKKNLLFISISLNFLLFIFIGYCYFKNSGKSAYFDFVKDEKESYYYSIDTTTTICFVGNSITANWINLNPNFFSDNIFINNGVGGQSSTQILLRFQQDVVLPFRPDIVVLNTGINDIGEADSFYNESFTIHNIQSIADICKANDIQLILTSVLPATKIKKGRFSTIDDINKKVNDLNSKIIKLAESNKLKYIDYYSELVDSDGNFNPSYTFDGIHPNKEGYSIMEKLVLNTLHENINNKE